MRAVSDRHECVHCGAEYTTPLAAALCCDSEYDEREDARR